MVHIMLQSNKNKKPKKSGGKPIIDRWGADKCGFSVKKSRNK